MEIFGRRIKYEDGKFYLRAFSYLGVETKKEKWNEKKAILHNGYLRLKINVNNKQNKQKYVSVHRLVYKFHNPDWDIFDSSTDNSIDHINGNTLDNRIENLRVVTHQGNQHNQVRAKGYSLTRSGRYGSHIKLNNKKIHLGTYDTEDEARQAYLEAKKKYHVIDFPRTLG
jgi:hypothetical protein